MEHGDFIRIAPDVKLGHDVILHAFVNLYGCTLGDESRTMTNDQVTIFDLVRRDHEPTLPRMTHDYGMSW